MELISKRMTELRLSVEKDPSSFWSLKDEWMSFLSKTHQMNPFLTPHWIGLSYEFFAGDRDLFLVTVRDKTNQFIGAIPWAIRSINNHIELVQAVPEEIGFYIDFPLDQRIRTEALKNAIELVTHEYPSSRISIRFQYLREDSPNLWALGKLLDEKGIESEKLEAGKLHHLLLPESYEDFIFSLKKRERAQLQKIGKRARRIADLEEIVITRPEKINSALDVFLRLFRLQNSDADNYLTPGLEAYMREMFLVFAQQGWTSLFVLRADGWNIASILTIDFFDTAYVLAAAQDPQAKELSPLALLLNFLVKHSIERHLKKIEFINGELPLDGFPLKQVRYYLFVAEEKPVSSPPKREGERASA